MDKIDITIIGAGAVGLAVAATLSRKYPSLIVAEKNDRFGAETSSRNSEVIHSGIYYLNESLKHKLCVRGNDLIYAYLKSKGIKHIQTGKIVVAVNESERASLTKLKSNGDKNGVKGLKIIEKAELMSIDPRITALCALLVPSTGIFDTHSYMQSLLNDAKQSGATVAFNSEVSGIRKITGGYRVEIKNAGYEFETERLINCAGLSSDKIAGLCGIDIHKASYKLYYSKGQYFRANKPFNVKTLVYPVPVAEIHSLGIHLTPDLAGGLRLGPDAVYVDKIDYEVDERKGALFANSVRKFFPDIAENDLCPDTAGIRPKLQGPNEGFRDFVINEETQKGFPGLINLVGIESPGLTSSLAIAEYVQELIEAR